MSKACVSILTTLLLLHPHDWCCSNKNTAAVGIHALSTPSSVPFGPTTRNVATQILQGAGTPTVNLNQYNLYDRDNPRNSLETVIASEWTASLVQKAAEKQVRLRLGAKTERENYVDSVTVTIPRKQDNAGLGLSLLELAGGRDDGVGITIIESVVDGGPAAGADVLPGDSIASVAVVRTTRIMADGGQSNKQTIQETLVQTECLSYDATVAAIQSLPPLISNESNDEEYFVLKLRRLRRKPKVTVKLQYPPSQNEQDVTLQLFAGENLRYGMLVRGIQLNDALAQRFDTKTSGNCGAGGLCRTCAVSVIQGDALLNPQRAAEQQMLADVPRWRLACKAIVGYGMQEGELRIRVNPRQWN